MVLSRNKQKTPDAQTGVSSKKSKKGEFTLFVGDEGAILCCIEDGEVTRRLFAVAPDDKSSAAFKALLEEHENYGINMIVDMIDQSYVRHTLPPVTPLGVNKIIQRRLDRDFAPDDIKGAISLGREKSGRKDWNFLLIALSYNDKLRDWCDLLYDLTNRFKGIYLAPVESEYIINQLARAIQKSALSEPTNNNEGEKTTKTKTPKFKKPSKQAIELTHWNILITHNKTGGFRQVVLKGGKLVFTRVAQSTEEDNASIIAGNVEQEVKNTIEYLRRLSFNNYSTLDITIIIGEDIKQHISADAFQESTTHIITPYQASELLGIQKSVLSGDRYADILLSCAFAKAKKKKLRLATPYLKKTETLYKAHTATFLFTILCSLSLLGASAYYGYSIFSLNDEISESETQAKSTKARLNDFKTKASTFEEDPFKVDSLIKIHDLITAESPDYFNDIQKLAPLIDETFTVNALSWDTGSMSSNARDGNINSRATPSDDIKSNMKVEFEILATEAEKKFLTNKLDAKLARLQTIFPASTIEKELVEGLENSDELTINFEENATNTLVAGQKVTIPVIIKDSAAKVPSKNEGQP